MADEKKKSDPWDLDAVELLVILIFITAIVGSLIPAIWNYITSGRLSFFGYNLSGVLDFFRNNVEFFKALGFVVAGAGAIGTFAYNKMGNAVWREELAKVFPGGEPPIPAKTEEEKKEEKETDRWQRILKLAASENSSDWRFAIIEADIILDELLDKLQLPGETMGEKLKVVEKSDFVTIELAWEAHKARNAIAHEGNNYLINQREVRRIISLYEAVFKEFYLI